MNQNSKESKQ